ncbi:MAG: lipid-A-disaccharide synthase N-terminal domain-containing protein [Planctomycetota bacterium]
MVALFVASLPLVAGQASPTGQVLAWIGNACYFSRFLIQWFKSERSGRTEAPRIFWWLSVFGAVLLATYTWLIGEPILMLSYLLVLGIYVRNLSLGRGASDRKPASLVWTIVIAIAGWGLVVGTNLSHLKVPVGDQRYWTVVAMLGTAIWSSRFIVQWLTSERRGEAYFPRVFWWLSLAGNSLLLAYVIHLGDTPLIAGYSIGPLVQVRNLMIAYRK